MKNILFFFLVVIIINADPVKYSDSRYWKTIQLKAENAYAADVGVPLVVGKASMGDVIATATRSDGQDIVITDAGGTLIPRELTSFSKTDSTFQLWYKDPATSAITGGTVVYVQWGGSVDVADDATVWADCYGGSTDHALVVHGEQTEANLIDATGGYTALDTNLTYNQTGKILKAPEFGGVDSRANFGDVTQLDSVQKFTLMLWMNQDTLDRTDYIFYKSKNALNYILLYSFTNGNLYFDVLNGAAASGYFDYSSVVTAGTYAHIVQVYDGTQAVANNRLLCYVDKTAATLTYLNTIPTSTPNMSGYPTKIGNTTTSFDGKIDELRVVAGALTANQISCQYDNQNGFSTNAVFTIGSANVFIDTESNLGPYRNDLYKTNRFREWLYRNNRYR